MVINMKQSKCVENNPDYTCTGMSSKLAIVTQKYWICRHLNTMMSKKGNSDIQSYWKSYWSNMEKTLRHLTHIFMTMCDFSHLRSDVRELANTRRKKKTESQAMASFQEEKNI